MGRGLRLRLIWWWMGVSRLQLTPRRAHVLFGWNIFAAVVCTCSWIQSSSLFTKVCWWSSSSSSHCCGSHQSCVGHLGGGPHLSAWQPAHCQPPGPASGKPRILWARGSRRNVWLYQLLAQEAGECCRAFHFLWVSHSCNLDVHQVPDYVPQTQEKHWCRFSVSFFFYISPTRCEKHCIKNFFLLIQYRLRQTLCLSQWV